MFLEAILLSFLVAIIRKGSIRNFTGLHFRHIELMFLSFLIQFALDWSAARGYAWVAPAKFPLHLFSYGLLFIVVYYNRKLPGILVMGAGSFLNFLVIAANGAMPVRAGVLPAKASASLEAGKNATHMLMGEGTLLPWLADIIYLPYPSGGLISAGDVVISLGLFIFVQKIMVPPGYGQYKITNLRY